MHHVVVVGGGIAGLTAGWELARRARRQHHDVEVTVIEARGRCGGKVVTRRRGDFVLEGGPDAFVARKPALYELACELGLEGRLLPSNDDRGGVALAAGKRLVPLSPGLLQLAPGGWREIAATPLLSWSGKLRWWAERWQPARRAETDESVADFVRRRCGREVLERIAEPILASLHVGDVERMSLAATCPHLRDREQRRGRLGGGRPAPPAAAPAGGRRPVFWSLRGGLEELIAALEAQLGATSILRGRAARRLRARREPARFELELDGGRMVEADAVILATPAAVASALTRELAPALAADLAALRAASVAVISLAYRLADAPPTPGFGFFVPRREGRTILAGTWMSTKFDHRAPPDHVLLRVFAGGAHDPQAVELPDGELLARAAADLRQLCGIDAAPVTSAVERWREGYPQYDVGHPQRIRRIESKLPPGLFLAGSPYHGVGLPDCAASGRRAAVAAVAHLATLPPPVMAGAGSLG